VTVDDNTTLSGGTYLAKSATQTFNSNLTVSGGTFTGSAGLVYVEGDLTISRGSFTAPSTTLYLEGDLDSRGGTFTHNNGTVRIGTDRVVSSLYGTDFYNLTCENQGLNKELQFEARSTKNIFGTLTLRGTSNNLLRLRSTIPNQQWTVNIANYTAADSVTGRRFIEFVDVEDSYNISGDYIFKVISHIAKTWEGNSLGFAVSGNNTNWFEPIVTPPEPRPTAEPTPPESPKGGGEVSLGDNFVNYEAGEMKFHKDYNSGKYRTVVIVFEGKVVVNAYDEQGVNKEAQIILTAGQSAEQKGEVKGNE
jgi:hypothetical protein